MNQLTALKILFNHGLFVFGLFAFATAQAQNLTPSIGPVISNIFPSGLLAPWTTTTNVIVNTDVNATCRYDTLSQNTAYTDMLGVFSTTGAIGHSFPVTGIANGETRTFYISCQANGVGGAANDVSTAVSVSVAPPGTDGTIYAEDFEVKDPFTVWAYNGTYTLNQKKIVADKFTKGKQSLYLDVTLNEATYLYFIAPIKFPSVGSARFSGDIFVTQATGVVKASLGTSAAAYPAPYSGFVNYVGQLGVTPAWQNQPLPDLMTISTASVDNVMRELAGGATGADTGNWVDGVAIYIWGDKGSNIKMYVDNLKIDGHYTSPLSDYTVTANSLWSAYKARIATQVNSMADYILSQNIANLTPFQSNYLAVAKARATEVKNATAANGFPTATELSDLSAYRDSVGMLIQEAALPPRFLRVYPVEPTKDYKITEVTYPLPTVSGSSVSLRAAKGEFEPVSFVLRANNENLSGVKVRTSAFAGPNGSTIPLERVDTRLVKTWYQAGKRNIVHEGKFLVPELLVHDDGLISNDLAQQKSLVRVMVSGAPQYIEVTDPIKTLPAGKV